MNSNRFILIVISCLWSKCGVVDNMDPLTHLKGPVVLVVLHYIHEIPSQRLQKIRRIHLGLDLELRAQPERQRNDFMADVQHADY